MDVSILALFRNLSVWSAFLSWLTAQCVKMALHLRRTGRVDFQYLVSLGGMPSAHSAMICGLTTSVGIGAGFGSNLFAVSLALATIVMFDASTVRRAAGLQARLLNEIVNELFREHHLSERKLKELLGHTRLEVFVGMLIGVTVAVLLHFVAHRTGVGIPT